MVITTLFQVSNRKTSWITLAQTDSLSPFHKSSFHCLYLRTQSHCNLYCDGLYHHWRLETLLDCKAKWAIWQSIPKEDEIFSFKFIRDINEEYNLQKNHIKTLLTREHILIYIFICISNTNFNYNINKISKLCLD